MILDKQRILIIGNSGSGKSTFAKFLGNKLDLKVYHLDRYFWNPGWQLKERDEWININEELLSKESWIIEGNYSSTLLMRALRSDFIFFFDYNAAFCVYRILKRNLKSKLKLEIRDDLANGCDEKWFDLEFVKFVWNFNKNIRPRNYNILEEINYNKDDIIIFRSRKEFKEYLEYLTSICDLKKRTT